jgi:hypothetical protein
VEADANLLQASRTNIETQTTKPVSEALEEAYQTTVADLQTQPNAAPELPSVQPQAEENSPANKKETLSRDWYPAIVPSVNKAWEHWRPKLMDRRIEKRADQASVNKQIENQLKHHVKAIGEEVAQKEIGIRHAAIDLMTNINYEPAVKSRPEALSGGVESMPRDQLMDESSNIIISGASLREVYESKRISETALRRLVAEYRRGGDLQMALVHEIVEHEKSFERDPILRDEHPMHQWLYGTSTSTSNPDPAPSTTGASMLERPSPQNQPVEAGSPLKIRKQRVSDKQFLIAGLGVLFIIIVLIVVALAH